MKTVRALAGGLIVVRCEFQGKEFDDDQDDFPFPDRCPPNECAAPARVEFDDGIFRRDARKADVRVGPAQILQAAQAPLRQNSGLSWSRPTDNGPGGSCFVRCPANFTASPRVTPIFDVRQFSPKHSVSKTEEAGLPALTRQTSFF